MRIVLTIVFFALSLLGAFDLTLGQRQTCSCKGVQGSTCIASVTCSGGCSAICGSGNNCFVSCSKDLAGPNLTLDFSQKDAKTIAVELSEKTKMRISFKPDRVNAGKLYDYHMKKSDIWRLLEFLNNLGSLKVNGISFDRYRQLQRQIKSGQRLSVKFNAMPAEVVAERLSFMSGSPIKVTSGDPTKPISVTTTEMTLSQILRTIKTETGVKMEVMRSGVEN